MRMSEFAAGIVAEMTKAGFYDKPRGEAMNETVKAALLNERAEWLCGIRESEAAIARDESRVQMRRLDLEMQRGKLADIELHLRDNGVDLAAVDAEAEKARPVVNLGGQHSVVGQQRGLYQDSLIGQNQSQGQRLQAFDRMVGQYDPTAGLAKALDEA